MNGQVHWSLDRNLMTIDTHFSPQPDWWGTDLNLAFQMDGDYCQDPYPVWLDEVTCQHGRRHGAETKPV